MEWNIKTKRKTFIKWLAKSIGVKMEIDPWIIQASIPETRSYNPVIIRLDRPKEGAPDYAEMQVKEQIINEAIELGAIPIHKGARFYTSVVYPDLCKEELERMLSDEVI